jgi:predicted lipoprotein
VARSIRSAWRAVGVLAIVAAALAVVRPWTVRPLVTAAPVFDATRFAERAWPTLTAEASQRALDMAAVRQVTSSPAAAGAPGRTSSFVKLTGTVTAIDRKSRVGLARLHVTDGAQGEVAIQIGPVVRGTALRDATSFIRFNDFANQFEYAAVSNALHERVLRDVVAPLDLDALTGKRVTVLGAATLQAGMASDAVIEIVPIRVEMTVAGGAR